jgi:hypothetical protein
MNEGRDPVTKTSQLIVNYAALEPKKAATDTRLSAMNASK